jgi:hypothetical protein
VGSHAVRAQYTTSATVTGCGHSKVKSACPAAAAIPKWKKLSIGKSFD